MKNKSANTLSIDHLPPLASDSPIEPVLLADPSSPTDQEQPRGEQGVTRKRTQISSSRRKQLAEEESALRKKVEQIKNLLDSIPVRKDPHDRKRISYFLEACRVLLERGFELEVNRHVGHFLWERQQRGSQPFQ